MPGKKKKKKKFSLLEFSQEVPQYIIYQFRVMITSSALTTHMTDHEKP